MGKNMSLPSMEKKAEIQLFKPIGLFVQQTIESDVQIKDTGSSWVIANAAALGESVTSYLIRFIDVEFPYIRDTADAIERVKFLEAALDEFGEEYLKMLKSAKRLLNYAGLGIVVLLILTAYLAHELYAKG